MKVNELLVELAKLNLGATLKIKTSAKTDVLEIRVDTPNVYKQKEILLIVGTKKSK